VVSYGEGAYIVSSSQVQAVAEPEKNLCPMVRQAASSAVSPTPGSKSGSRPRGRQASYTGGHMWCGAAVPWRGAFGAFRWCYGSMGVAERVLEKS